MSEFLRGLSGKSSSTDDGKTDDFFQRDSQFVYNMTGAFKFLLCFSLLLAAAQSNVLNANDFQTCMDLCASCDGKASFENGICKCSVREDDTKGMECVKRLKREVEDLSLDATSDDIETGERSARCSLLGNRRRIASEDADRVASYFMNGGPITGTPLGSTNSACLTSSGDPVTGAINPGNAKPRPAEPEVEKKVDPAIPKSPVVAAPNHACSSPQYQPMVSSSWIPSHDGYAPMIGAPQPYQTGFYPHMLGAIPHMVMAIPNAVMRAASQIPSHHSGMLGASHHSPILASLASGTHGVLQRLDKMVSPYASDNHNNMVGAPQHQISDCQRSSHPTYSASNMVGAPAARVPDSSQINTSMLQQVLAHQNSLLEALSHQLGSLSPQVGAPRMQYAPVTPSHYMLGAPHPMSQYAPQQMGQYVQQPMSHYCPDGSSMVSSPKAAESPEKPAEVSSKEPEKVGAPKDADNKVAAPKDDEDKVAAPKDAEDKSTTEDKVGSAAEKESNKKIEESKKSEDEESQKTKRETRSRSTSRKKRGDVKYAKKRETQSFSY